MKCFNHDSVDAVAICKNCNKGLCHSCLTEVENGVACTKTCIEEVTFLSTLIGRSKKTYKNTSSAYYKNAIIYGSLGLIFLLFGLGEEKMELFLLPAGIIFIIGALFMVGNARKYNK